MGGRFPFFLSSLLPFRCSCAGIPSILPTDPVKGHFCFRHVGTFTYLPLPHVYRSHRTQCVDRISPIRSCFPPRSRRGTHLRFRPLSSPILLRKRGARRRTVPHRRVQGVLAIHPITWHTGRSTHPSPSSFVSRVSIIVTHPTVGVWGVLRSTDRHRQKLVREETWGSLGCYGCGRIH